MITGQPKHILTALYDGLQQTGYGWKDTFPPHANLTNYDFGNTPWTDFENGFTDTLNTEYFDGVSANYYWFCYHARTDTMPQNSN